MITVILIISPTEVKNNQEVVSYTALLHGTRSRCTFCGMASILTKRVFNKNSEIKSPFTDGFNNRLFLRKHLYLWHSCSITAVVSSPNLEKSRNFSNPSSYPISYGRYLRESNWGYFASLSFICSSSN